MFTLQTRFGEQRLLLFFIRWLTKNRGAYENDLSTVNVRETQRDTKRAIVREIALTF